MRLAAPHLPESAPPSAAALPKPHRDSASCRLSAPNWGGPVASGTQKLLLSQMVKEVLGGGTNSARRVAQKSGAAEGSTSVTTADEYNTQTIRKVMEE